MIEKCKNICCTVWYFIKKQVRKVTNLWDKWVQWVFNGFYNVMKKVKTKSKLEWFKKNIVIVPVVAAIIAGTFTSVRYVLSLTDTITANQQETINLTRWSLKTKHRADITDLKHKTVSS